MNKTVLLTALVLLVVVSGAKIALAQTVAPTTNPLTSTYASYINLFGGTSGLSNPLVQNSTTNNDASGLTFTVNLNIQPPSTSSTVKDAWGMVDSRNFLIELCNNTSSTECWLSQLNTAVIEDPSITANNSNIYEEDSQGNYLPNQTATVSAFIPSGVQSAGFSTVGDIVYTYNPSTNISNPIANVTLQKGAQLTASLWYCAAGTGASAAGAYKAANITTTNPTTFGTLCNGSSYFQIGQPLPVTIPATAAGVQQQAAASQQALAAAPSYTTKLPACSVVPWGTGTINGCAAQVAYGIYQLTAWVAGLFGELFDFFIGYSVSSASYSYPFVITGWTLVRDISNIFFIIIMVYTGFTAVFDTASTSMKKVVPALIINALLINFSLFFTHVVIDISNITARIFYDQMVVCKQTDAASGNCTAANELTGTGGYPQLSVKIVSSFDPQNMFKSSILNPPTTSTDGAQILTQKAATALTPTNQADSDRDVADYYAIVSLVAAGIMILIAIMFFKVSFLFIGRVVGLYICMIFSPFAFLSRGIPAFGKIQRFKWDDWLKELSSYAMMAPIFIFFLYIIYTFLSSNFVQQIGVQALASSGFFQTVMSIGIPMLIIYFLLRAAQSAAEGMSGEIGKYIQKVGEQATGFVAGTALGIATGGASLAGTGAAGVFKLSDQKRNDLEAKKAAGGFSGQMAALQLKSSDWTQKQTFDARNTKAVQFLNKNFGTTPNNALVGGLGFGSDRTKGGREGQIKRSESKTKEEINSIKTGFIKDSDAVDFWYKHLKTKKMEKRLDREAEALYAEKYKTKVVDKNSAEFKTEKENAIKAYGNVTNNKQLTQALRTEYASTILNTSTVENIAQSMGGGGVASIVTGGLSTGLGVLAGAGLALGGGTDQQGKDRAAKTFLGEEKKRREKLQKLSDKTARETTLEEEKDGLTKKLDGIEKILEKSYKEMVKRDVDRDPANAGKSASEKQAIIDAEVVRLKNKENAADAEAIITRSREELQNTFDEIELDVKRIDEEYKAAIKEGDAVLIATKKDERYAAIAKRTKTKTEYEQLDPKQKRDLQNDIDRRTSELERIKEKKEGAKEKELKDQEAKDKPADDKKDDKK